MNLPRIFRTACGFVAVVSTGPALALSCLPVSVERSFQEAQQAAESYVIVHGTLHFDDGALPRTDHNAPSEPPPETALPARLDGQALGINGFRTAFDKPVTLRVACFGPWCGSAVSGQDVLAFLRRDANGYALEINPCGGFAFPDPAPDMLRRVKACFRGARCEAKTR